MHDGGAPGVSSLTIIALSSGIGVVALANADEKQEALTNITIAIGKKALQIPASSPPANKRTVSPPQHKRRADAARAKHQGGVQS
jgi:hypothetical protein